MSKFQPGQSGNPGGRPKDATLREIARAETEGCIQTLVEIRDNKKTAGAARVSAAIAILDRGWGRPHQTAQVDINRSRSLAEWTTEELTAFLNAETGGPPGARGGDSEHDDSGATTE